MKFGELRSIAHNIADSLASGMGLPIGVYAMDIFGEARRSPQRCIVVDFLSEKVVVGNASPSLTRAIVLYRGALVDLCKKQGCSPTEFHELTVRYSTDFIGRRFAVTVENRQGRRSVDEYVGIPGRRIRTPDHLGRVRRRRGSVSRS